MTFFFFFFFGDAIAVINFSGKNLVPPQIGLRTYAHEDSRTVIAPLRQIISRLGEANFI